MMENQDTTVEKTQTKSTGKKSKSSTAEYQVDQSSDGTEDVQYLLSQCEALVQDRNSWKERAFEAERLISELKKEKQELIQAITQTLNIKG